MPAVATEAGPAPWPGADEPGHSAEQADGHAPELALDAEPGHDDPTSDEAHFAVDPPSWVPRAREPELLANSDAGAEHAPAAAAEPAGEPGAEGEPARGMTPVAPFERMWSSPTPPDG